MTFDITTIETWAFLQFLAFLMTVFLYAYVGILSIERDRVRRIASSVFSLALAVTVVGVLQVTGIIRGELPCEDLPWWIRWVECGLF